MDPFDQGWNDGTMDIGTYNPRPDPEYTKEERQEYMQGYREAQRGW